MVKYLFSGTKLCAHITTTSSIAMNPTTQKWWSGYGGRWCLHCLSWLTCGDDLLDKFMNSFVFFKNKKFDFLVFYFWLVWEEEPQLVKQHFLLKTLVLKLNVYYKNPPLFLFGFIMAKLSHIYSGDNRVEWAEHVNDQAWF